MKFLADLHLHSKYSRACSPQLTIPNIAKWAKLKGIKLMGTADFTHPFWFSDIKKELEEAEPGLYRLKSNAQDQTRFILSCEISCIYTQGGKGRRIHVVILAPSLKTAEKINITLSLQGNLMSDGRPILGMSAHDLVSLVLAIDNNCLIIPAHIWTPWFSLYGSNSGFDSLEECFGDLTKHIYAVETGLSSDPAMNWRLAELDNRAILSFSDAHSLPKLGREVVIFNTDLSYDGISQAIRSNDGIAGTIEFYPEEGKYHHTGHRVCQVRHSPQETARLGTTCPACQKKLTVGVMHRVEELATRSVEELRLKNENGWVKSESLKRSPYKMLVPLAEILAEALGAGVGTQAVEQEYLKLVTNFSSEFNVLLKAKGEDLEKITTARVAEGILKVRRGDIIVEPGYDGVFGIVKIWSQSKVLGREQEGEKEDSTDKQQMSLFE